MLESCSSRPRHGNDLLMTMREASPLGFQWLQCRAWELGNANLAGGGEVVFSKRFVSVSVALLAYKSTHAAQLHVHELVEQKEQFHLQHWVFGQCAVHRLQCRHVWNIV